MEIYSEYFEQIKENAQQNRVKEILKWVHQTFPQLMPVVKWNQPMFSDHGTYIIGFSVSQKHIAVAPEKKALHYFAEKIKASGYEQSKEIFRIALDQSVDYALLQSIIEYNILDKSDTTTFWRKD